MKLLTVLGNSFELVGLAFRAAEEITEAADADREKLKELRTAEIEARSASMLWHLKQENQNVQ